ncbi:helix-turn-helix domain-containing protein, partial [Enterococcus faecium]|nr:helix-turn-helix domain-containing protein [Enterococcus faecium]
LFFLLLFFSLFVFFFFFFFFLAPSPALLSPLHIVGGVRCVSATAFILYLHLCIRTVDNIRDKKASLKSLKDTWLDLSEDNPYSQFLITVMAGVNQLERDLIRMRQREGIELAKKEGKFKGRLKKYHKNHAGMNYAVKLYKEGNMTVNQICEITNVSRASLYRKLSEVNN